MKSIQEIAQFILERRTRAMPLVTTGEIISVLDSEAMQEALQRRWLVPEHDSGRLQVTTDLSRIAEVAEIAAMPPDTTKINESACASLAVDHANRPHQYLSEIAAPGTGKPAPTFNPPTAAPAPVSTVPRQTPTNTGGAQAGSGAGGAPDVGDDVSIAEGGRTYTGKVAARTPQGGYTLSFGPEGKPPVQRDYQPNEMRMMPRANA